MPKYHVTFAHADTRETAGELTEDTPKGWGNVEIVTDHDVLTQEDKNEIARVIGTREVLEDGSPRYTHIAINDIKLLDSTGEFVEEEPEVLRADEFLTNVEDSVIGIMLGQNDEYFALWGHAISDDDAVSALVRYFDYVDAWSSGIVSREEFLSLSAELRIDRVHAFRLSEPGDELLSIGWYDVFDIKRADKTSPVTIISIQS